MAKKRKFTRTYEMDVQISYRLHLSIDEKAIYNQYKADIRDIIKTTVQL